MRMKLLLTLGLVTLAHPAAAQTVVETDFVISVPTASGQAITESSTLVPLMDGACYDWRIRLKAKATVDVTEIYTLPAAPETWGISADSPTVISDDKLSATTPLSLVPEDGWISSGWCVSLGDPVGDYRIEVKSGDQVLATFPFEVRDF